MGVHPAAASAAGRRCECEGFRAQSYQGVPSTFILRLPRCWCEGDTVRWGSLPSGGGVWSGFYVGSRYYHYAAHDSYYRDQYRTRYNRNSHWSSEDCENPLYDATPRPEETSAWAIFTVLVNNSDYTATAFEVDLFRDLSWRLAPCNSPTDVAVMFECATQTVPTEAQYNDTSVCYRKGNEESVHSTARRNLLQFGSKMVVVVYVGVADEDKIKITQEAAKESIDNTTMPVSRRYKSRILKIQGDDEDDDIGKMVAVIVITVLTALCSSCACGLIFIAAKKRSSRSQEEPLPDPTVSPQVGYYPPQEMESKGGLSRKNDTIVGETVMWNYIESCSIENCTLTNCTISQVVLKGMCELVNCNLTNADIYGQVTLIGGYVNNGDVKHGGHLINYGAQVIHNYN